MTSPFVSTLNPAQREAVEHVEGPLLVLAGAGSGKTRVLTSRVAHLIEAHGVEPGRILAVTFTNKAAAEMKERIGRLLGRDPAGLWIGTFHALSARLLRREAPLLGYTRDYTIYDEDDRLRVIRRLLEQGGHPPKAFPPKAVQAIISGAKNRMTPASELLASATFNPLVKVAAEVYAALGPALRAANAMDFDDLLLKPLELFHAHPDRLEAWRRRFQFVLVDEFQDTNRAQYELVRGLGAHGNVAVVGDDDQSIYSWRGAEPRNMAEFQRDFPTARLVRLEENYRSTQVVLDAANAVIAENSGRIGKTLRTARRGGEPVTLVAAADERDEAEWIMGELRRRAGDGDWGYGEMAVLYRTNAQSRAMEEAFRRAGVPYRIVGATSFYDRREVKDLLAYLRLVANPADNEAFLRAVQVPRRGLGDASLTTVEEAATAWGKPLLAAAAVADRIPDLRPNVRQALTGFAALIDRLREQAAHQPPADLLEDLIRAIDYEAVLRQEGPDGADRWDNVRELVAGAAAWSEVVAGADAEDGTPLQRFLADAALLSSHDAVAGAEDGVTLMTVHTAKGLEWPVVVVAGLEDGLFPLLRAEEEPGGLEEERRLCYVALTRAKDKLILSFARSRRRGGDLRYSRPSRFLESLPPGILDERRTSVAGWASEGATRTPWRGGTSARTSTWAAAPAPSTAVEPEAAGEESQVAPRYVRGERVRHRRFGSGAIQGLTGAGRELKVTVRFDDDEVGTKQLLVAFAGLEREWEGA